MDYLKDYQEYYKARMDRYENDPDYANSYQSEKAIYEAIMSVNEMVNFKDALGNLNEKNAVALSIDEYTIRYNHYTTLKENLRALGPKRIIDRAPSYENVFDLMTMIGEEENKSMIEIAMDDVSFFTDNWFMLDRIEMYEQADIPSSYKSEYRSRADKYKTDLRQRYNDVTEERRKWDPNWKFNFNLIFEERHRRLIPYSDEHINEKIAQFKSILNP